MSWWLMNVETWRWLRVIRAEPPCNKGEIQIGHIVFGWQTRESQA